MQDREPDHIFTLVADYDIVIRHFTVGRVAGLLKIYIERVGFSVIGHPYRVLRRPIYGRNQLQVLLDVSYGHSRLLFPSDRVLPHSSILRDGMNAWPSASDSGAENFVQPFDHLRQLFNARFTEAVTDSF